ncbi:anthrone oxygenase family protein [Halalkalibacter oceani]|uniref:anthrone oxygenase family protein n=1 Tax=Halalkalibacter oceani TaxID=1653776 RepID=UPI003396A527
MIEQFTSYLIFCTALGSGLVAGLFFAFSTFVMRALAHLPTEQGVAAMQSINRTVLNRWFLAVFMGTTLASVLLIVISLVSWGNPGSAYLLVGSVLYLLGGFLVTVLCNVPLNDALASVDAEDTESVSFWKSYMSKWTAWNHIRTITSIGALASFILSL